MADDKGVRILKEQYFFGFGTFFSFLNDENKTGHPQEGQANTVVDEKVKYLTPIRITNAQNVNKTCVSWSCVFHLFKDTGKVHVCGWCNGRKISAVENVLLPIDCKIMDLQASWNRLVFLSNNGKCHVILNIQNDWTATVCGNESKLLTCDVGDLHTIVLDESGIAHEIKRGKDNGGSLIVSPIHLKVKVNEVSCGKEHVLLLSKTTGHVFSFGLGSRGQLGHGEVNAETTPKLVEALAGIPIQQVAAGGWHSMALSDIGDIYAWGWNNCGQLGITCLPPEVPQTCHMLPYIVDFPQECTIMHIACGARHSGAVMLEPRQSVWTWGWGQYGQLGHGNTLDQSTPTEVEYFKDIASQILDIHCGPWQTLVTLESSL